MMNRAQKRNLITILSLLLVIAAALVVSFFARGYRLDLNGRTLRPTGILSINSVPEGAQVWIDGELKTATDQTVILSPGEYQIEIKKPGFSTWKKIITIEKEVVAEVKARLFLIAPNLKALTFTGANWPQISPDGSKLIYFVTSEENSELNNNSESVTQNNSSNLSSKTEETNQELDATTSAVPEETKIGLWLINLEEKPLGQSFQPRALVKLTPDFDFKNAAIEWSPDSRKIMLIATSNNSNKNYFLLDINQSYDFTTPPLISEKKDAALETLSDWQEQKDLAFNQLFKKLPEALQEILIGQDAKVAFSPDETKILYQAKENVNLPEKFLTKEIVGASTQKESRQLEAGSWYIYDLKEDKNFLVLGDQNDQISWFPTSNHLLIVKAELSINVVEYDGQNQTTIYSGPFEENYVFPFPSGEQLLILTSLNKNQVSDLYSVSLEE